MSQLAIYLPDDRSDFEPMETISVEAQWELDSEPDSLQLRVVWNTSGKGDTNISTKKIITIDSPGMQIHAVSTWNCRPSRTASRESTCR